MAVETRNIGLYSINVLHCVNPCVIETHLWSCSIGLLHHFPILFQESVSNLAQLHAFHPFYETTLFQTSVVLVPFPLLSDSVSPSPVSLRIYVCLRFRILHRHYDTLFHSLSVSQFTCISLWPQLSFFYSFSCKCWGQFFHSDGKQGLGRRYLDKATTVSAKTRKTFSRNWQINWADNSTYLTFGAI